MIIRKMVERIRRAAPYRNPFLQFWDIIWHKLKINTHPADYYLFEFYKRDKSWDEKKRYISRYGSYYWPYDSILLKDMSVLTNKYINKHMLLGLGLSTPELLAVIGEDYEVRSREDLKARMRSWHFDIIVKPISSSGGAEVFGLTWKDGQFLGDDGKVWSADYLWDHLSSRPDGDFLVERRVFNIGQTAKIYPHSLNTFRIITIRALDGEWHVPIRMVKFGSGEAIVDNIGAGGIIVLLDDQGVTIQALGDNFSRPITHHPDTGLPLIGVKPEGFEEVVALAVEASKKFVLFGTIGWDIAYTADGPMIIEGNTLWGTNYQRFFGPIVKGKLIGGLKKRTAFTRYSRDRIYPAIQRRQRWPWKRTRWWV